MLEYSENPALSRLYHEEFQISVDTHAGEDPFSATKKLPVQPVIEKDPHKIRDQELPSSEPGTEPPGRQRPKRHPSRLYNPDPILPGLQIKMTHDFQVKIILCGNRGHQWTGPTA
jgi:hypothetical protein